MLRALAAFLIFLSAFMAVSAYAAEPIGRQKIMAGQYHVFFVTLPQMSPKKNELYPAVIALHGEIGDGHQMNDMTRFGDLGQKEGFVAAFPDASKMLEGTKGVCEYKVQNPFAAKPFHCRNSMTWEHLPCCESRLGKGTDQVRFITALIDTLISEYRVDPKRIYLVGHENGAEMAFRYVCEHPEKIAAMAAVGGNEWHTNCMQTARAVPTLYIHGTADKCWPYDAKTICGSCRRRADDPVVPNDINQPKCQSAPLAVKNWIETNGCKPEADHITREGAISCQSWTSCRGGSNFSFCTIDGYGSFWPKGDLGIETCRLPGYAEKCKQLLEWMGPVNQDVDATAMIWDFFKQRQLPTAPR